MTNNISHQRRINELSFPALILVLLLFYTYGIFVKAPYIGFYFNPTDGRVLQIFEPAKSLWVDVLKYSFAPGEPTPDNISSNSLQPGDILLKVGTVSLEDFHNDRSQPLLDNMKDGEIVDMLVNRNGREIIIPWKIPGFNQLEFFSRFFNVWWLAFIFWFFGFTTQIFVRPKDMRWGLFTALNYLTALWIIFGALSGRQFWGSSILLHAVTWMLLPIYLHFHWLFPKPLSPISRPVIIILYAAAVPFIAGELFQLLPRSLYVIGFMCALFGSLMLQFIHFISHPEQRREVRLVGFAVLLALLPSVTLSISGASGAVPQTAIYSLLTLPFMPLMYLLVIYRGQFGELEMRVNRFVSLYAYLILLGVVLIFLVTPVLSLQIPGNASLFFAMGFTVFIVLVSIVIFPAFQVFVEERLLGIKLPYENLVETYSERITTSVSLSSLQQLLEEEVFPSLLVRQFAFIQIVNGVTKTILAKNVDPVQLLKMNDVDGLSSQTGRYLPENSSTSDWVRLILPLKVGDNTIGFWLLGRRDPDDSYPQAEILILQSLANQTAIALSNILHMEQLKKMYQFDVERSERERMRLALDLHDSILNQLAVLRNSLDDKTLSPNFQASYEELTRRLREIVTDLRPPMLMYGLKPAIESLADNIMERSSDNIKVAVAMGAGEERTSQNIEQHLFRIVQEACENAIRHSHCTNLKIHGSINSKSVDLSIEDDGTGFEVNDQLELDALLSNNHFGLAGMIERAYLIGGEISLQSKPGMGTKIQLKAAL